MIKLPYIRIANPEVHREVKTLANDHGIVAGVLVSEIFSASLQTGEAERIAEQVEKKSKSRRNEALLDGTR